MWLIALFVAFIFVLACIAASYTYAKQKREQEDALIVAKREEEMRPAAPSAADEEWEILCKYDSDVKQALEIISHLGEGGKAELKKVFLVTKEKSKLVVIAKQIADDHERK